MYKRQVQNIASPGLGATEGTMLGINAAFLVCTVLCLVGLVMPIALVKDKPCLLYTSRCV